MEMSSIRPKIVVFGLGSPGVNTINELINHDVADLKYVAIDSYGETLDKSKASVRINLGNHLPKGLGVHNTLNNTRKATKAEQEIIQEQLKGVDAVIVIAGLGGNTGAAVAPLLASYAINACPLSIFVGVIPFSFEGVSRRKNANNSLQEIKEYANKIVLLNLDDVFVRKKAKLLITQAFEITDVILYKTIYHIYELLKEEYSRDYYFTGMTRAIPYASFVSVGFDDKNVTCVSLKESDIPDFYHEYIIPVPISGTLGLPVYREKPDISSSAADNSVDFIDIPEWMKKPLHKSFESRPEGKDICRKLRAMRVELAKANNIPFQSEECSYDGPCAGTCEKCDREAAYLRDKLNEITEDERIYPHHIIGKVDDVL